MPSRFTQHETEKQIREEFRATFDELERASQEEKADAADCLKRATRRLYDFARNRKLPQDSRLKALRAESNTG
jgi:hypothetical protein